MGMWRFLKPRNLGFTLGNGRDALIDRLTGRPSRPLQAMAYVKQYATPGDSQSVLDTLDQFANEVRWLMSIGPAKNDLIQDLGEQLPSGPRILELGAYCGYSSIAMAMLLDRDTQTTSIEVSADCIEASRANVEVAGLSDRIEFVHGPSTDVIPTLKGTFDLVFLDHWKDLYKPDLKLLESHGLITSGSVIVADNVGDIFAPEPYLDYVRNSGKFTTEHRTATIEYTSIPDAVEISVLK